ncbi:MAG: hypothetical protein A2521_16360 [Deltaproteobacteria bacterium RIFOXYD12_FULL_57_12]|nr:MAG: hypothetical protein A2521_16360 [Deltaproteobacteria bacterium RIFOXYD12_FULL_57_12]
MFFMLPVWFVFFDSLVQRNLCIFGAIFRGKKIMSLAELVSCLYFRILFLWQAFCQRHAAWK